MSKKVVTGSNVLSNKGNNVKQGMNNNSAILQAQITAMREA